MACGDKYTHLLKASGGRTTDEPFSSWCNEADAEAWFAQATYVHKLQVQAWNALMKLENDRDAWPKTDAIKPAAEAYDSTFQSLPEPSAWMAFGAAGCAEAIGEMIANLRQGACILEQLNDAIEGYGSTGIDPGASGGTGGGGGWAWWVVGGVVAAGVVGGLAYYATTRPSSSSTTVVLAGNGRRNGNGNGNGGGRAA